MRSRSNKSAATTSDGANAKKEVEDASKLPPKTPKRVYRAVIKVKQHMPNTNRIG